MADYTEKNLFANIYNIIENKNYNIYKVIVLWGSLFCFILPGLSLIIVRYIIKLYEPVVIGEIYLIPYILILIIILLILIGIIGCYYLWNEYKSKTINICNECQIVVNSEIDYGNKDDRFIYLTKFFLSFGIIFILVLTLGTFTKSFREKQLFSIIDSKFSFFKSIEFRKKIDNIYLSPKSIWDVIPDGVIMLSGKVIGMKYNNDKNEYDLSPTINLPVSLVAHNKDEVKYILIFMENLEKVGKYTTDPLNTYADSGAQDIWRSLQQSMPARQHRIRIFLLSWPDGKYIWKKEFLGGRPPEFVKKDRTTGKLSHEGEGSKIPDWELEEFFSRLKIYKP